jgi:predicted nucleotidyltransferase
MEQKHARWNLLVDTLHQKLPHLLGVYLFGSQAQENASPTSDVDVAILAENRVPIVTLWEIAKDLERTATDRDVDLVDLRGASTVFQHQIITTGICLWSAGLPATLYEIFILREKMDFDAARQGLLADIAKEGTIYGRRRHLKQDRHH